MRLIVCKNQEEMSEKCARLIAAQVCLKPNCVLGLATGSTPLGTYACLAEMYKKGDVDFSGVTTFNLDEYYPISSVDPNSYHVYMKANLFDKVNVPPENIHILNGETADPEAECAAFEESIKKSGGIDLQLLGIGENGHIGFNEPDISLSAATHLTYLTESTVKANSRFFKTESDVPDRALTMGISTILNAKKIILLASGKKKHNAVTSLLTKDILTESPATMLKVHNDAVIICDKEAYEG